MRPFETLEETTTHEGRRLALHRRDGELYLHLDGEELMSTRSHGSETALAEIACAELGGRTGARVLVGGLGLGFTLRGVLDGLPSDARVTVAELFPEVVDWNRRHLPASARALSHRRVRVVTRDVRDQVVSGGPWDAILLDVDDGPSAWCVRTNGRLYDRAGLDRLRRSLAADGLLAVWSAYDDPPFAERLRKAGFDVAVRRVRAHAERGSRHTVFVGRVGAGRRVEDRAEVGRVRRGRRGGGR